MGLPTTDPGPGLQADEPELGGDEQPQGDSLLAGLRAKREQRSANNYIDLEVPHYDGILVARYRPVEFKLLEASEKRVNKEKGGSKLLKNAMEQMILCCEQMLVRDAGNPACFDDPDSPGEKLDVRPVDVAAFEAGTPIKWEKRLADLFGVPEQEHQGVARNVIRAFFATETEITDHSAKIGIWLKDTSKDVNEGFLGE